MKGVEKRCPNGIVCVIDLQYFRLENPFTMDSADYAHFYQFDVVTNPFIEVDLQNIP